MGKPPNCIITIKMGLVGQNHMHIADFSKSPPEILMASVSASRIKRETLCTQFTGLWGRSWSKSAYWILWSL